MCYENLFSSGSSSGLRLKFIAKYHVQQLFLQVEMSILKYFDCRPSRLLFYCEKSTVSNSIFKNKFVQYFILHGKVLLDVFKSVNFIHKVHFLALYTFKNLPQISSLGYFDVNFRLLPKVKVDIR